MSAEILREAATLMRERAGAVDTLLGGVRQPGWQSVPSALWVHCRTWRGIDGVVDYAASWHPAVALAVADWLDAVATRDDEMRKALPAASVVDLYGHGQIFALAQALAVASAYLG